MTNEIILRKRECTLRYAHAHTILQHLLVSFCTAQYREIQNKNKKKNTFFFELKYAAGRCVPCLEAVVSA